RSPRPRAPGSGTARRPHSGRTGRRSRPARAAGPSPARGTCRPGAPGAAAAEDPRSVGPPTPGGRRPSGPASWRCSVPSAARRGHIQGGASGRGTLGNPSVVEIHRIAVALVAEIAEGRGVDGEPDDADGPVREQGVDPGGVGGAEAAGLVPV